MEERFALSQRQEQRLFVIRMSLEGKLTVREAALRLDLSSAGHEPIPPGSSYRQPSLEAAAVQSSAARLQGVSPLTGHFYLAKKRTFLLCVDSACRIYVISK